MTTSGRARHDDSGGEGAAVTQHLHDRIIPGCYRCELGRDEVRHIETCEHEWMDFGGPGDEWRECFLCGLQEDA